MRKADRIAALVGLLLVFFLAALAGCPIDVTTLLFPSGSGKAAPVDASTSPPPPVPPAPANAYPTHSQRAVDTSTHDEEPERTQP